MTIERDEKGRFVKGGTKNPKAYTWTKNMYHSRKGLTKGTDESVLRQSIQVSKTLQRLYKEGKIKNKIVVIPHGFNPELFYPKEVKRDKNFTFVCVKGWKGGMDDRGGLQFAIKAFGEEFKKSEKVCMKLKVNMCYNPNLDINAAIKKLGIKNKKMADLLIVPHQVELKELNNLYNEGDVFVNTSMADAFSIPVIEAMATGLPVLTTTFGGMSDFVNEKNGWLIDKGEMVTPTDIQYENCKWNKPDIKQIREKMRYCFENQDEVRKKGIKAMQDATNYTWFDSAKKLLKVLEEK